jgi:hypothetical protein
VSFAISNHVLTSVHIDVLAQLGIVIIRAPHKCMLPRHSLKGLDAG